MERSRGQVKVSLPLHLFGTQFLCFVERLSTLLKKQHNILYDHITTTKD